ncbi:MAG: GxxExxY protein [Acidobacteria bacterium]|nr:MAG: GxxExxY protein [Acidobacteriota bacterium]
MESKLTDKIIGAALIVHKTLGPGFIESVYEEALCVELTHQCTRFERQKNVEIFYGDAPIAIHRMDLIVEKSVVVELKAIRSFEQIHFATIKSYLKASGLRVGLLLNFNHPTLVVKRFVL